jgi:uncharacterized membrane protein
MNRIVIKNKKFVWGLLVLFVFLAVLIPVYTSLAQEEGEFRPITTSGVPNLIDDNGRLPNLEDFLAGVFTFLIGAAAVLAVIQITTGGIQYMTSNAAGSIEDAKDKIRQAIIGLLLILATYIILNTINPALVNISIGIPEGVSGGRDFGSELPQD